MLAFGGIEIYAAQGVYQIVLRKIEPQGIGALQLAFEQLQKRLQAEGLFDPARKKPIPTLPKRIGIVTSSSGAAVRDFLEIALRRWPKLDVTVIPAKVQGPGAAKSIVDAIKAAHRLKPPLDVLVIGRGGGSMEDLWCFNEEPVVRAIAASLIPTVSAVGHEIDVTLADFAADIRALTPSEAAERIIPEYDVIREAVDRQRNRLVKPITHRIALHREKLRFLQHHVVFRKPHDGLQTRSRKLDELDAKARVAIESIVDQKKSQWNLNSKSLFQLNPLAVLSRGFSVTRLEDSGVIVRKPDQVKPGDRLETILPSGTITSKVIGLSDDASTNSSS